MRKVDNPCYGCDCWDSDREGCTMPSCDKDYACTRIPKPPVKVNFNQLVAFQHSYSKSRGRGWILQEHEQPMLGYVVGVRTIGIKGYWESVNEEVWGRMTSHMYYVVSQSESVYLVATSMGRMYRVRKSDVTELL